MVAPQPTTTAPAIGPLILAVRLGLPIKAIAAGEIRHRGCLFVGGKYATFGVIISHGSYHSLYIHLQAPDNPKYNDCNTNRRPGSRLYGQKSVDYTTTE